jgi:hypothetical protein
MPAQEDCLMKSWCNTHDVLIGVPMGASVDKLPPWNSKANYQGMTSFGDETI